MSNLVIIKKSLIDPKTQAQIKMALPANVTPEKFVRVAMTALNNSQDLANCTPESVMNGLLKCAADGLLPDNREAALVKFGNQAQYMPMVYGLIKRMRNSGEVSTVNAYIVYENDDFEFEIINGEEKISHKPKIIGDRGQFILVYAVVSLKDGGRHVEVMTKAEVDKTRDASRSKDSPAWKNWYDEMAKKAVIHRAAKRVPTASEVDDMIQRDYKVSMTGTDAPETPPEKNLIDNLNEAIEADVVEEVKNEGE